MSASGGQSPGTTTPTTANVADGFVNVVAAGTTTLVTVPAGRTWVGYVGCSCAITNAGAATTLGAIGAAITTANGTGTATPAAGSYARCDAEVGAQVAGGTVGEGADAAIAAQRLVVIASAGGTALIQLAVTVSNGAGPVASGWAIGELQ